MKPVYLITAVCKNNGIGLNNTLPWKLKNELQYFTNKTTETSLPGYLNAVVMGRKTWESVPKKFKPFPGRLNVVISNSQSEFMEEVLHFNNVQEAVASLQNISNIESIWIIGGAGIYKEALDKLLCDKLYITKIDADFNCDTFFPELDENTYELTEEPSVPIEEQEEMGIKYKFTVYNKKLTV